MPAKRVLDIGNCGPDHGSITAMLSRTFDVQVLQADRWDDALPLLEAGDLDLVVVNRKLDIDYSDGMDIIRKMKDDPRLKSIPVMIITNYPEHDQAAVEIGAEPGFGKQSLHSEQTRQRLNKFLA